MCVGAAMVWRVFAYYVFIATSWNVSVHRGTFRWSQSAATVTCKHRGDPCAIRSRISTAWERRFGKEALTDQNIELNNFQGMKSSKERPVETGCISRDLDRISLVVKPVGRQWVGSAFSSSPPGTTTSRDVIWVLM